jgi:Protein of unknown function (DUF3421)
LSWQPFHHGQIPPDAIETGYDVNGELLLIGHAKQNESLSPGKVQKSHGRIYMNWFWEDCDNENFDNEEFEVLVVHRENGSSILWPVFELD